MKKSQKKYLQEINQRRDDLYKLMDDNPLEAVKAVDKIDNNLDINMSTIKASIYIDAGFLTGNSDTIKKGITILTEMLEQSDSRVDCKYNLANGYFNLISLIPHNNDPSWFLTTREQREKARQLYYNISKERKFGNITTQALTNFGSILIGSQRSLEAYDAYIKALEIDPQNGMAATGVAKLLLHYSQQGFGDEKILRGLASKYLKQAKINPEKIQQYGGPNALKQMSDLLDSDISDVLEIDCSNFSSYQKFVYKHRLALTPTIECVDFSFDRWDSLNIRSIIEPIDTPSGPPPIFAMHNTLKSDYLASRWLAFKALDENIEDSGYYNDTLDYANYGINISLLTIAQRSCLDILDKIAIATSEYFKIDCDPNSVKFMNRWFKRKQNNKPLEWDDSIANEIAKGNHALIALCELCEDLKMKGTQNLKKSLRHASTHRFAILHDLDFGEIRESKFIEHYKYSDFKIELIETLQIVRSAIFYFTEMIRTNECLIRPKDNSYGTSIVPGHHEIRGD